MPFYPFICDNCKETHDIKLSMSEAKAKELQTCSKCGQEMRRKFIAHRINFRQPLAGRGMEIYTNAKDAEDQLFESIVEEA